MTIKSLLKYCSFALATMFISYACAENTTQKKIPKWKLEQRAKVANAAKVCNSPNVNPKVDPNDLTTGFYTINLIPDVANQFLDMQDGSPAIVSNSARKWLLSEVGFGLYKISTCADQKPVCLAISTDKEIITAKCDVYGYGDQVWWLKGYAVGPNKGGWFLGNDGVGQMDCLTAGEGLRLETCNNEQHGWRFERVNNVSEVDFEKKNKTGTASVNFPNGVVTTEYLCESGTSISTYYDATQDSMMVRYDGLLLTLEPTISGSGAKFGGKHQPWGWWTKGNMGAIYQTNGEEAFLENCKEAPIENMTIQQPLRLWQAQDFGENAVVADCTDCEEDLGLLIRCQKGTPNAQVTVFMDIDAAIKTEVPYIEATVANQTFQYPVKAEYFGMLGHHIPTFEIHQHEPFLLALKRANSASFKVNSNLSTLGLTGSNQAINRFVNYCGWSS